MRRLETGTFPLPFFSKSPFGSGIYGDSFAVTGGTVHLRFKRDDWTISVATSA